MCISKPKIPQQKVVAAAPAPPVPEPDAKLEEANELTSTDELRRKRTGVGLLRIDLNIPSTSTSSNGLAIPKM
jgi:hypothetical protein